MGEQSTGTWNSRAWHDEVEERKARFKEHNQHDSSTVIAFFGVRAAVKALNLEYET